MANKSKTKRKATVLDGAPKSKKQATLTTTNPSLIKERAITCERFVKIDDLGPCGLALIINKLHWRSLMTPQGKANASLVREFFSRIDKKNIDKKHFTLTSVVRGVKFTFSAAEISKHVETPALQPNAVQFPYPEGKDPPTKEEITKALYIDGILHDNCKWKQRNLKPDIAVLHLILWFNLDPRGLRTEFDDDRGHLLHAIYNGIPVDVGKYMWNVVESVASNTLAPTAALPFGIRLTEMLTCANVKSRNTDEMIAPTGPIGKSTLARSQGQSKKHRGADDPASLAGIANRIAEVLDVVKRLENTQSQMDKRQVQMDKELKYVKAEFKELTSALLNEMANDEKGDTEKSVTNEDEQHEKDDDEEGDEEESGEDGDDDEEEDAEESRDDDDNDDDDDDEGDDMQ